MKRLLLALALPACTVGQGAGDAAGPMFIDNCKGDIRGGPRAAFLDATGPDDKKPYGLHPGFFAAEPIQDVAIGPKTNRLIIRLQTTGRRREANDILRFDIPDSRAVARCVRGRILPTGEPDYDTANCFWGPNGARLRVGPDALVHSYFTPDFTCNAPMVGTALSTLRTPSDGMWESWIQLLHFGTAAQPTLMPNMRQPVSGEFKVQFDERLAATAFQLQVEDDAYVKAVKSNTPPPQRLMTGQLLGWFDFEMQRGQGAQTFP